MNDLLFNASFLSLNISNISLPYVLGSVDKVLKAYNCGGGQCMGFCGVQGCTFEGLKSNFDVLMFLIQYV